jgi:hypothetical protein
VVHGGWSGCAMRVTDAEVAAASTRKVLLSRCNGALHTGSPGMHVNCDGA